MYRIPLRLLTLLGVLALVVAACGGSSTSSGAGDTGTAPSPTSVLPVETPPEGTVIVELTDFTVESNPRSAPAGKVTFDVRNNAEVGAAHSGGRHNFVVLRTDTDYDSLPLEIQAVRPVDIDVPEVEMVDDLPIMEGRTKGSLTTKLKPGSYVLLCNLANHYVLGMRAEFSVR